MTSVEVDEVILSNGRQKEVKVWSVKLMKKDISYWVFFFFFFFLFNWVALQDIKFQLITLLYLHLKPNFSRAFTCSLLCRHHLKVSKFYLVVLCHFSFRIKFGLLWFRDLGQENCIDWDRPFILSICISHVNCWKGFSLSRSLIKSSCSNS